MSGLAERLAAESRSWPYEDEIGAEEHARLIADLIRKALDEAAKVARARITPHTNEQCRECREAAAIAAAIWALK